MLLSVMDSARLVQLFVISLFSAAVALIGLNELSHRFIKSGLKDGHEAKAPDLVRQLRGEINPMNPLEHRPTPLAKVNTEGKEAEKGQSNLGAVSTGLKHLKEKLLPR